MGLRGFMPLLLLSLAGCVAPPPAPPVPEGAPADFPVSDYRISKGDERVYAVDPRDSLLQAYVFRSGALARLGHDHVVAARNLGGFAALSPRGSGMTGVRADLYAALGGMTVDEPELRQAAGFTTEPADEDREGTRRNMLASLEAAAYPFVTVAIDAVWPTADAIDGEGVVSARIRLHGIERTIDVPVTVISNDQSLSVSGAFDISQRRFGIEPFSVMGGALAVADTLELRFSIRARRWRGKGASLSGGG